MKIIKAVKEEKIKAFNVAISLSKVGTRLIILRGEQLLHGVLTVRSDNLYILRSEFKNTSLDSKSAPPRYHVSQCSVKMDNFEFFGLNLGKLPNYAQYFGTNIVEGAAENWVEAEMRWVEVDGAGWSWVELNGAGWSWVHGLVIPNI